MESFVKIFTAIGFFALGSGIAVGQVGGSEKSVESPRKECFSSKKEAETFFGNSFVLTYLATRTGTNTIERFKTSADGLKSAQLFTGSFSAQGIWDILPDGKLVRSFQGINEMTREVCTQGKDFYLGATKMTFSKE